MDFLSNEDVCGFGDIAKTKFDSIVVKLCGEPVLLLHRALGGSGLAAGWANGPTSRRLS